MENAGEGYLHNEEREEGIICRVNSRHRVALVNG